MLLAPFLLYMTNLLLSLNHFHLCHPNIIMIVQSGMFPPPGRVTCRNNMVMLIRYEDLSTFRLYRLHCLDTVIFIVFIY